LTDFNNIDSPGFTIRLDLIGYDSGQCVLDKDDIRVVFPGCSQPHNETCVYSVSHNFNQTGHVCTFEFTYGFPTTLAAVATWTMNFFNVKFYAAAIIYTIYSGKTGTYTGTSYLQGYVEASPGTILRGSQTLVQIVTTVNFIENCYGNQPVNIAPGINATTELCKTDPASTKILNQEVVTSGGIPASDYYVATKVVYSFALQIAKGPYFKHIKQHLYYDTAFVVVWIILFGIGNIAILQIAKGFFESFLGLPKRIKEAPTNVKNILFGEIPEGEDEGEKGGKEEVEMKEKK